MNIIPREPFSVSRWEPFREMEEAMRQFAPFFARGLLEPTEGERTWRPVANISETEQEYLIKAELPEVKKEDIEVTVEDGILTLRGDGSTRRKRAKRTICASRASTARLRAASHCRR